MPARHFIFGWAALALGLTGAPDLQSADERQCATAPRYVELRNELDALNAKLDSLELQIAELTEARARPEPAQAEPPAGKGVAGSAVAPDSVEYVLVGDANALCTDLRHVGSSYSLDYSPLFLVKATDRLLVEAGLDLSVSKEPGKEHLTLDKGLPHLNVSYAVSDYLLVGAGRFAAPFAIYRNHIDAPWVNKLPDDPLPFGDNGIAPGSVNGVFATGAFPVRRMRFNYAVYAVTAPHLVTTEPAAAGSLRFDGTNTFNFRAAGGRVGFQPVPELEVGYSLEGGKVSPDGFHQKVRALLQAMDLNYVRDFPSLRGKVTARTEWVWSHVSRATYDPTGTLGFGPLTSDNDRNGGYALLAYRPTHSDNKVLKNLEFVLRYDRLSIPSKAPGGGTEWRWTPGLDYWITPSTVLKAAYVFDHNTNGPDQSGLMIQFAIAF